MSMPIVTRHSCFETNSSSSHSIKLDPNYDGHIYLGDISVEEIERGVVDIHAIEFGWGCTMYTDFPSKMAYIAETYMYHIREYNENAYASKEILERLLPKEVFNDKLKEHTKYLHICERIKEWTGLDVQFVPNYDRVHPFGYIDHQSMWRFSQVVTDDEKLKIFLFSEKSELIIDNDNNMDDEDE